MVCISNNRTSLLIHKHLVVLNCIGKSAAYISNPMLLWPFLIDTLFNLSLFSKFFKHPLHILELFPKMISICLCCVSVFFEVLVLFLCSFRGVYSTSLLLVTTFTMSFCLFIFLETLRQVTCHIERFDHDHLSSCT